MALLEKAFLDFLKSEQYEDFKHFFCCSRSNYIKYKDNWETSLIDYFLNYTDYGKRYGKRNINTLRRLFHKYLPTTHKETINKQQTHSSNNFEDIEEISNLSYVDVDDEWRKSRFDMSQYKINLQILDEEFDLNYNDYDNDEYNEYNEYSNLSTQKVKNNNIMAKRIIKDDIVGVFLVYNNNKKQEIEIENEIEEFLDIECVQSEEENLEEESVDETTDYDYW